MVNFNILNSINLVSESWDKLASGDTLLRPSYLRALEEAHPANIQLYYLEVFKNKELVGIAVIQRVKLYLNDMFRNRQVSCIKELLINSISKVIRGNLLVVGNLTHTGQHGVCFDENQISLNMFYQELFKAVNEIQARIKTDDKKLIRAILLKDFFLDDSMLFATGFEKEKFHKVKVQPNMLMQIRPCWQTNQDYVSDLNKKYRDRFKRAKRKLNSIIAKELSLEDIRLHSKKMYQLYLNVSDNAKFNTFILPDNHFYVYKLHLNENLRVFGYFLKDELVGFYTLILNKDNLETYFLGYDKKHQYPNQLYLNMLYDMLKFGIENGFKEIVYARTAMEIKSSVGAKPEPMVIYLKHTNSIINSILKPIFKLMSPSMDWEERHPFKQRN